MPTYSYRCTACDHAFDIQQAFTDDSLSTCPECGKALRKVFSAIGVTFQGSGFYRTDSRAENKKTSAGSSSAKKSDSQASSSSTPSSAGQPSGRSAGQPSAKPAAKTAAKTATKPAATSSS